MLSTSIFPCDATLVEFNDFERVGALDGARQNPFDRIAVFILHQKFDVTNETPHIVDAFDLSAAPFYRAQHLAAIVRLLWSFLPRLKQIRVRIADKIGNIINQQTT